MVCVDICHLLNIGCMAKTNQINPISKHSQLNNKNIKLFGNPSLMFYNYDNYMSLLMNMAVNISSVAEAEADVIQFIVI